MKQKTFLFILLTGVIFLTSCSKEKSSTTNPPPATTSPGTYLLFDEDPLFNSGQHTLPYTALFYSKLDGTGLTQLTNPASGYLDYRASFSGDGKHIVFVRDNLQDPLETDRGLYEINTSGDSLRLITQNTTVDFASLSPDGSQVAYGESATNQVDADYQIIVSNVDGTSPKTITSYTQIGSAAYIHWAKNNVLYFAAGLTNGNSGIYSCNPDGSNTQMVLAGAYIMSVSNDGKYLLYYENSGLYYCTINGQNPKLIMSFVSGTIGNPAGATMTDDDKQAYFYYSPTANPSAQGIYKVNVDGSGLTQVLTGYYEIPSIF